MQARDFLRRRLHSHLMPTFSAHVLAYHCRVCHAVAMIPRFPTTTPSVNFTKMILGPFAQLRTSQSRHASGETRGQSSHYPLFQRLVEKICFRTQIIRRSTLDRPASLWPAKGTVPFFNGLLTSGLRHPIWFALQVELKPLLRPISDSRSRDPDRPAHVFATAPLAEIARSPRSRPPGLPA